MNKLFVLIFLIWLPSGFITVEASDYAIPDIRVEVSITEDGLVQINEHRTYRFNGSFSWADYRLPKQGFSEIRNIRVSEQDEYFINENTEQPGTFSVSESSNAVIIKWHYRATDETRTFTISYELTDAVMIGPDWSEFFWNYLASGREKSTDTFRADIRLANPVPADSLHAWSRGPADLVELTEEAGTMTAAAERITSGQSIQVRTLFPTSVFDQGRVSVTDPELSLIAVQAEEERLRRQQIEREERAEFYASITGIVTFIIILLSIGLFIYIYRRYGKRHSTGTLSNRETVVIPGRIEPALIGRLMMHNSTTSQHLVATLFDLARRGWYTIREEEVEKSGFFSLLTSDKSQFRISRNRPDPDDHLLHWEQMIVNFADKRIAAGKDSFRELFKGSSTEVSKWYSSWNKAVKRAFEEKNWIDKESYKGVIWNVIVQLILLAGAVYMVIMGTKLALAAVFATGFMLIGSFGIIRRTPEGQELHHRWKLYRDGLKNADRRTIRMEMTDRHFIYAIALHLSQKQLSNLMETMDRDQVSGMTWIILMHGSASSPAKAASALSTLAATGTSSFAGTSGGSGASTGSAGGGASGGAG